MPVPPALIKGILTNPLYATDYVLERVEEGAISGRVIADWSEVETVRGVLARAAPEVAIQYGQRDQRVSHILTLPYDAPEIRPNDRFAAGAKHYWVTDVVDPSGLGLFKRIMVEERPV